MPGGDGTGPMGMGPMTGRAMGYCAGYPMPGYMNPSPGRSWFGRGGGRGRRHRYYATGLPGGARTAYDYPAFGGRVFPYGPELTAKEEMDMLKDQAQALKQQMKDIQGHISTLEKAQSQENK